MCLLRGTDWFFIYNSTFRPHGVFMSFVWISEQTAIISLYSINWLVFITETECVYWAVRTGSIYMTVNAQLAALTNSQFLEPCQCSAVLHSSLWCRMIRVPQIWRTTTRRITPRVSAPSWSAVPHPGEWVDVATGVPLHHFLQMLTAGTVAFADGLLSSPRARASK